MVIRCERCSTTYELDEGLLAPEGSPVQCTRCNHVFTARPPQAPGRTLIGVPAAEPAPSTNGAGEPPAAAEPRPAEVPPPAARPERPSPKPVGPRAGPPVYRPAIPTAAPSAMRPPSPARRDTLGAFESRLRWAARLRWLVPAAAAVVVAIAVAAWLLLSRRGDPAAERARTEALAAMALDDVGHLEQATRQLADLAAASPRNVAASADRALAQLLAAGALLDEGDALAARAAERAAERDRLRREAPPGWEEQERTAAAAADALAGEVRAREERARTLSAEAFAAVSRLEGDGDAAPEVGRTLATYYALGGDREKATKAAARDGLAGDPWAALAVASLGARGGDAAARERAAAALGEVVGRHPELIRARLLLARTQLAIGRKAEAVATLDGLLAANPRHEQARALREELTRPPPPPAPPPPEPAPTPVAKPAPLQRKPTSQPAPAAGASAPAPAPPDDVAPEELPAPEPAPTSPPPAPAVPDASGTGTGAPPPVAPGAPGAPSPGPAPRPVRRQHPADEPWLDSGGG